MKYHDWGSASNSDEENSIGILSFDPENSEAEEKDPTQDEGVGWNNDLNNPDLKVEGPYESWPMVLARLSRHDSQEPLTLEEQDLVWDQLDATCVQMCEVLHSLDLAVPMVLNRMFVRVQGHKFPQDFVSVIQAVSNPENLINLFNLTSRGDWHAWAIQFIRESRPLLDIIREFEEKNLQEHQPEYQQTWADTTYKLRQIGAQIGINKVLEVPQAHQKLEPLMEKYRELAWKIVNSFVRLAIRDAIKYSRDAPHFVIENFQNSIEGLFFTVGKYKKGGNFVHYASLWCKDFLPNYVAGLGSDPTKDFMNDPDMLPDGWTENRPDPQKLFEGDDSEEMLCHVAGYLNDLEEPLKSILIIKYRLVNYWEWVRDSQPEPEDVWDQCLRHLV